MATGPYNFGARKAVSHSDSGQQWRQTIYHIDCFDSGLSKQNFGAAYDIVTLAVGGGTNEVLTNPSRNTLITGAVLGNTEGTRSLDNACTRSREYAIGLECELSSAADIEFRFGFYKDADEYIYIEFDKSLSNNWRLHIDDGTGAEFSAEGLVAEANTDYYMLLWVETDGTPHWAIGTTPLNIVEMGRTGIANVMTADYYYYEWYVKAEQAVVKQAKIDYFERFKTKLH